MNDIKDYQVTSNRMLVQLHEVEKKTSYGIFLVEDPNAIPTQGVVIATGPGKKSEKTGNILPMRVSVGDKVLVESGTSIPLKFDGYDVVMITEDQAVAVIDEWIS